MFKEEFFRELKSKITNVPGDVMEDILADFEEHFKAGSADGLTEQEICQKLGQPGSIAEEIMEEFKKTKVEESQEQQGQSVEKIRGGYEISKEYVFNGVTEVEVDMHSSAIHFVRESRQDVRVEIEGKSRYDKFVLEVKDGKLRVFSKEPIVKFELFSFRGSLTTTIRLPMNYSGKIKAKSSAGKIRAEELTSNIHFTTHAGSIAVSKHQSKKAYLDSSAGSVNAEFLGEVALKAHSGAGSIKIKAEKTTELDIDTGAGSIQAEVEKLTGTASCSSGAGSVKLTAYEVMGDIKLSSGAGSIRAFLPENADIRIQLKKSGMGSVKSEVPGNDSSPYTLKASTGVGSVRIKKL